MSLSTHCNVTGKKSQMLLIKQRIVAVFPVCECSLKELNQLPEIICSHNIWKTIREDININRMRSIRARDA